ncbi:MAG: DUF3316 domain-containing protein [Prevotella sp.]|nr:DUF3316 domain-containing protein [Prevotella sp.]
MTYKRIIIGVIALWATVCLYGQESEVSWEKSRSTLFAVGAVDMLDTYLSPEKYKGVEFRLFSQNRKTRNAWVRTIVNQGSLVFGHNRADNNDELGGSYEFHYHLRREWTLAPEWTVEAGGGAQGSIGFLYNMRNSNNPAQARFSVTLNPSVATHYNFRLFKRSVRLHYEASAPLLGLMFSPNYGQSYYEIFGRGNYDRNIVPTTIGATPSLRHMLTFDIPLSRKPTVRTTLRIGYLGDYWQAKVNNLKYHQYSHLLVVGWTKRF